MSGIAGIYNLDGRPADGSLLRRMTDVIAHRGPDGAGHWVQGPVALGHRMLHTTPEALLEQQPLTDETGAFCLTLDGRVDNREELRAALEDKGYPPRTDTDAELVLRAYECWGEDCPARILGDFAFAIWDGRKRQLFCARDIMGLKPFYYYTDGRRFLFASELHQILEDAAVPRVPNEELIAEYLSVSDLNLHETLYQGIFHLPRANALIIHDGQVRTKRYWDIDWGKEIRYRNDQEYTEHFLEIFKEAVRCRLRSHRPIGAELSGGLDSSSVVSMVQWLYGQGSAQSHGFETFSLVFPGQPHDESAYIGEVVRRWGFKSNEMLEEESAPSSYVADADRYRDLPDFPNGGVFNPLMARTRETGIRILLSGDGGDQWLTGSPLYSADLLRRLRIRDAFRQSQIDSRILAHYATPRSPLHVFLRWGVFPLLPRFLQAGARRIVKGERGGVPPWISPSFARQTRLTERIRERETAVNEQYPTVLQREHFRSQLDFPLYWLIDRSVSRFGLEYRYPFMDRKVIEYCLALPQDQIRRDGQAKWVLRQAMKGILPEAVRTRLDKSLVGIHTFRDTFRMLGAESFFDSLVIASKGWVDGQTVRQMYQHVAADFERDNARYRNFLFPLWLICSIELWFKAVFPMRETRLAPMSS